MGREKPRTPIWTPEELADRRKMLIIGQTDLMRSSEDSMWVRIRQQLAVHGVNAFSTILADSEPLGSNCELGFVITSDREVFQYTFSWEGTLFEEGAFSDWKNVTSIWMNLTSSSQRFFHRDLITWALEVQALEN